MDNLLWVGLCTRSASAFLIFADSLKYLWWNTAGLFPNFYLTYKIPLGTYFKHTQHTIPSNLNIVRAVSLLLFTQKSIQAGHGSSHLQVIPSYSLYLLTSIILPSSLTFIF